MRVSPTYLFYDLETTGLNPSFDQILQFAAVRLDSDFNELERFNFRVALSADVIPNPGALLVNRIHPDQLKDGLNEYEAIKKIFEIMNKPGTISLGYNTLGFDDEFLRFAFFRHLLPPYWHQYKNDCHRMDIYPMVLLAYHLQSNLLRWPVLNEKASFKLEHIVQENQLRDDECGDAQSHDALVDVLDTIALAKKLRSNEAFWERATAFFDKKRDETLLSTRVAGCQIADEFYAQGFMMECQPSLPLMSVLLLGKHAEYKNQSRWLRLDKVDFNECAQQDFLEKLPVIRKKEGEPPFFFSDDDRDCLSTVDEARRTLINRNIDFLRNHPHVFLKIRERTLNGQYADHANVDANAALYKLPFPAANEESLFRKFHLIDDARKEAVLLAFPQHAHRALAIRLLGRHRSDLLSADQKADYDNYIHHVFSMTDDNVLTDHCGKKKLTIADALVKTGELLLTKTTHDEQIRLQALKQWYEQYAVYRIRERDAVVQDDDIESLEESITSDAQQIDFRASNYVWMENVANHFKDSNLLARFNQAFLESIYSRLIGPAREYGYYSSAPRRNTVTLFRTSNASHPLNAGNDARFRAACADALGRIDAELARRVQAETMNRRFAS